MSIPKGILATDKWFQITNYAGNDMDTSDGFNASSSSSIDTAKMGKIVYSSRLTSLLGNSNTCTRETCVPPTDGTYFSIIDISKHLAFRMDHFITELYALSNCIQNCNLTPPQGTPRSCVVDGVVDPNIQYCNNQLYGKTTPPDATNDFLPYMKGPTYTDKKIDLDNMPTYKTSVLTTINIKDSDKKYQINPNPFFDLNSQYIYIQNLINTFDTLLNAYKTNNNKAAEIDYTTLLNKRVQMDTTLEEIFGKNNTMNMQSLHYYDSTIYTSIFWTVLVTSLLFYTFRKL
jgi:hypothetical protein